MDIEDLREKIMDGKIFIYPTDTVYGLGCNALNERAVDRIKDIKKRDKEKPLSVIAPSLKWIEENCIIDFDLSKYLPGPYTVVLRKKEFDFLDHVSFGDTLGVRIPVSGFCDEVRRVGVPFVSTSVNLSGEKPVVSVGLVNDGILDNVDEVVDEGNLNGKPSTLVIDGKELERD